MTPKQLLNNRILLGHRLAEIRKERGLTQQQVADDTGILRPHIARIEGGRYNVSIDILAKVMAVLDCEIVIAPN